MKPLKDSTSVRPKSAKPTMHDVAAAAGVSQMTVSRVLREEGYISEDVKKRVEDAASALGYIRNRMASVQRGMQNPMIGVVLPTLKNTVFVEVLEGINDTLSKLNMRPVFGVSEYCESQEEELVHDMMSWQPCGLILSGMEHTDKLRRAVSKTGIRVAEIMDVEGEAISASFGISQTRAGREMADHLVKRGYRKIAYLGSQGGADLRAAKRYEAFKKQTERKGGRIVYERIAKSASSMALGRQLTEACLSEANDCDAIYYSNDDLTAGGLMHCISHDIDVPRDVALAGFNDLPFLLALPQRITTTRTPRYEMGAMAAEYVAQGEEIEEGPHELIADLVIGDTT